MEMEGIGIIGANKKSTFLSCMLAARGFQVRIYDTFKESLSILLAKTKWKLEREDKAEFFQNIEAIQDYSKFKGADIIFDLSSKTYEERFLYFSKILKEVDNRCIIAISTHTTLITNFEKIPHLPAERAVGIKFPFVFPWSYVEVSKTDYTDLDIMERFIRFLDKISLRYVITGDIPGGLSERFIRIYLNSAFECLYKGKGFPSFIDYSIKKFTNTPLGPFELLDERGIDDSYNTAIAVYDMVKKQSLKPHEIEQKLFQYGQLGKKSSMGIYLYEDGQIVGENPILPVIAQYIGLRSVSEEEIFSDIMIPVYDEAMSTAKELMVGEQDIENITKAIFGWEHGIFGYKKLYPQLFVRKEKTEFDNLDTI